MGVSTVDAGERGNLPAHRVKLPYGTWMGEDKGIEPTPAPKNMVVAMAIAAFFCTFMGVVPGFLYGLSPLCGENP